MLPLDSFFRCVGDLVDAWNFSFELDFNLRGLIKFVYIYFTLLLFRNRPKKKELTIR